PFVVRCLYTTCGRTAHGRPLELRVRPPHHCPCRRQYLQLERTTTRLRYVQYLPHSPPGQRADAPRALRCSHLGRAPHLPERGTLSAGEAATAIELAGVAVRVQIECESQD
ncbi:hypothetical protein V8D89_002149, partial [Ganoderma adspersum]